MRRRLLWAVLLGLSATALGCKPDLGAPPSLVIGPRFLAVRGLPPEAPEGGMVTYDVLVVDTAGTISDPTIGWAQCLIPDPPANGNDVSSGCLSIPDDTTAPSPTFAAPLPANACTLFGPETPPPMKGQPPTRPADPDTTGGFYQPVRANWQSDAGPAFAFALERIICPLANAPTDIAGQFASTLHRQQQPDAG